MEELDQNLNVINPCKLIPENLRIKNAANRLYNRGITPIRSGFIKESNKHKLFRSLIALNLTLNILKHAYLAHVYLTKTNSEIDHQKLLILTGDFAYHLPAIRAHWAISITIFPAFSLSSLFLHHSLSRSNKYKENFQWIKLFSVLSGEIKPKKIGLTNEEDLMKIIKRSRVIFWLASRINDFITPTLVFIMSSSILYMNNTLKDFIVFGIPWSIAISFNSFCVCNEICWHLAYFHIICYYFSLQIKRIYKDIDDLDNHSLSTIITKRCLRKITSTFEIIHQFNNGFWCKYSSIMFTFYNFIICVLFYQTLYEKSDPVFRFVMLYLLILDIVIITSFILSATSVFQESKTSFKVFTKLFIAGKFSPTIKLKISSFLERMSLNKVGFWCMNVFVITQETLLNMVMMVGIYFMLIIQLSSSQTFKINSRKN